MAVAGHHQAFELAWPVCFNRLGHGRDRLAGADDHRAPARRRGQEPGQAQGGGGRRHRRPEKIP